MQDFTQIKLINNLIDIVAHFYRLAEERGEKEKISHLKGFSEGIAFTLVEQGILTRSEAEEILANRGVRRKLPSTVPQKESTPSLDIPTIFRKKRQKEP
ncbi:MAG: hypothetical protein B6D59_04160 [Campylobacteraceae bacterium 4484_4]|nr:MAG: hypothetical protein B6D59_04160 [Campylobacteraceae bacterium 4484_4]